VSSEIDTSALDAIKALQRPGQPDILGRIVKIYMEKSPDLLGEIESGVAEGDANRVKMAAHTLKSSSAYLGATDLATQCNQLESKAANDDLQDSQSALTELKNSFVAVVDQLRQYG